MRDKIVTLISVLDITQKKFAEQIGITAGGLTDFIKGRSKDLSSSTVTNIVIKFNVNPAWLLTGEGEMFTSSPGSSSKVMQSNAPQKNGHLAGHNGGVEEIDVDIDHVKWFRSLSRKKQTAILAIAEIEDEEYIDEVKGSTLFKLRQQREIERLHNAEMEIIRKKGEAG